MKPRKVTRSHDQAGGRHKPRRLARDPGEPRTPSRRLLWVIGGILLLALAIRGVLLVLTRNQPVWWDEAEYLLKARSLALGTPETGFFSGRPPLLPMVLAGFFAAGLGEGSIRFTLVLASLAVVALTYDVGRRLLDGMSAAIAALLMSVFYVPCFYTARVMTEIPHLLLCLVGIDLYLLRTPVLRALALPTLVLAALMRFPALLMVPILGSYAIVTERQKALRDRALLASVAIAAAIATIYLVWSAVKYGHPLHAWAVSSYLMPSLDLASRPAGLVHYVGWMGSSLGWGFSAFLVFGLVLSSHWVIAPRRLFRDGDPILAGELLVWLWAVAPVLYFGLCVRPLLDRYLILALPPLFLVIGRGATWLGGALPARARGAAMAAVWVVVVGGAVSLLRDSDRIVRGKLTSYGELRDAGFWMKDHSTRDALVMSSSLAQLTYYSERTNVPVPADVKGFERLVRERRPRYLVVSSFEEMPKWLQSTPIEDLGLRLVARFSEERPLAKVFALPGF